MVVLHPSSSTSVFWDCLVFMLVCYLTVEVPMRIAFFPDLGPRSLLFQIDLTTDLIFCVDIIKRFSTGYFIDDFSSDVVSKPSKIARNYLRTWFFVDFISSIPVELFVLNRQTGVTWVNNFRMLKLLKLIRLLRTGRLFKLLEKKIGFAFSPLSKQLLTLVTAIFVISHLVACSWFFMASKETENFFNFTNDDPDKILSTEDIRKMGTESNWLESYFFSYIGKLSLLEILRVWNLYCTSLYWASSTLTSVGFGDVVAVTSAERLFACGVAFLGSFLTGYIISSTTSMLSRINKTAKAFREQMDKIKAYLVYRNVPPKLSRRIIEYFTYFISRHALFDEQNILQNLSLPLRVELTSFLFEDVLRVIPVFSSITDTSFLSHIMMLLKPLSAVPGDVIYRQMDIGLEMYFVVKGELECTKDDDESFKDVVTVGDHFGELSVFKRASVNEVIRRQMTVTARTYCDIFSLSKTDFASVIKHFPEIETQLQFQSKSDENRKTSLNLHEKVIALDKQVKKTDDSVILTRNQYLSFLEIMEENIVNLDEMDEKLDIIIERVRRLLKEKSNS